MNVETMVQNAQRENERLKAEYERLKAEHQDRIELLTPLFRLDADNEHLKVHIQLKNAEIERLNEGARKYDAGDGIEDLPE